MPPPFSIRYLYLTVWNGPRMNSLESDLYSPVCGVSTPGRTSASSTSPSSFPSRADRCRTRPEG